MNNLVPTNIFTSVINGQLTLKSYLICAAAAIFAGAVLALVLSRFTNGKKYSYSFLCTIVLLPLIVQTVIMLVNGNVGTGVAVAGAFSLVRFRSAPGSAKDVAIIFLSMAAGLLTGTGYIGVCLLLVIISCIILFVLYLIGKRSDNEDKELRITIGENIDYEGVFDDFFNEYTKKHTLTNVKTTNMGSLFKLKYRITMKNGKSEKEFIDSLRVRNGNLEIAISSLVEEDQL